MSAVPESKEISLGVLLTMLHGPLLDPNFGDVQEAYEVLAGHSVWTHQLPRVAETIEPHLKAQFPREASIDVEGPLETLILTPDWMNGDRETRTRLASQFVADLAIQHGLHESYEIRKIDVVEQRNPITELSEMVGDKPILVVGVNPDPEGPPQ